MSRFFAKKKYNQPQPTTSRSILRYSGGTSINPDTAMEVSAYYSGLIYISTQMAKLPWEIKDAENNIIQNDVSKLLSLKPNPYMNSMFLRLFMIQSAITYGNSYAEIERSRLTGKPIAIWPIMPDHVFPEIIDQKLWYRIIGGSQLNPGEDTWLRPEDVYHLKNFHTKDGITGQGLLAYAYDTLGIAKGGDKFANSLFSNGGLPSGVLEHEGSLSEEAALRLKESWGSSHGGRKVGGTAVLEEGVSFKPISLPPEVLQFLESRKFSVIEIARFLRLPPTKLYDTESAKFKNVEQGNLEVAIDTLDAWARSMEMEADIKILNNGYGGRRTELNIYEVFRGDMDNRSKYFKSMMQSAAMTPNEIRLKEGMSPYEGGDRYYVATNNFTPVDRVDEVIDSQVSKSDNNSDDNDKSDSEDEMNEAVANYFNNKCNTK